MGGFVKGDIVVFTADSNIILYRAAVLRPTKLQEVIAKIVEILSA